jgi:hypothetical protein
LLHGTEGPECQDLLLDLDIILDGASTVISSLTSSADKHEMIGLANQHRLIAAASFDELKPALQAVLAYTDESGKEHRTPPRLTG